MWKLLESREEYVWDPEASDGYVGGQLLWWTYEYPRKHYIPGRVSEEQIRRFKELAQVKKEHIATLDGWFRMNGDGQSRYMKGEWKKEADSGQFSTLKDYKLVPPDNTYIEGKRGRAPEDGEYIHKFDEQQRTAVEKQMMAKRVGGACEPWTLGWIEEGSKNEGGKPRLEWYGGSEISAYIEEMAERKKAIDEANTKIWEAEKQRLPPPKAVPGHVEEKRRERKLIDIGRGPIEWTGYGDMETVKSLRGIGRVPLVPGNYYTFEMNMGAETSGGGHVFAMYQDQNKLIVFDQNYGILGYVGGLPRLVEVVGAELNLLRNKFVFGRLGGWCISRYQPAGS